MVGVGCCCYVYDRVVDVGIIDVDVFGIAGVSVFGVDIVVDEVVVYVVRCGVDVGVGAHGVGFVVGGVDAEGGGVADSVRVTDDGIGVVDGDGVAVVYNDVDIGVVDGVGIIGEGVGVAGVGDDDGDGDRNDDVGDGVDVVVVNVADDSCGVVVDGDIVVVGIPVGVVYVDVSDVVAWVCK